MTKDYFKFFLIIFVFLLLPPQNLFALENGTIKAASELDYPPFCIVTEDGEADGFSVELLRETLKTMDYEVSFYVGPWAEVKNDLADGKIQVLPLVGRTPEREPIYDFTFPYLTFFGAIFIREGDMSIKSIEDIKNKELLVLNGDNAEEYARRESISNKIITVKTYDEAFKLLSEGKHDALLAQEYLGKQILKKTSIKNVVPAFKVNGFRQDFTFAVKEGDAELLSILNEGLSKAILNGTFERLYDKWFPKEDRAKHPREKGKSYVMHIIGIILFIVVLFTFWINKNYLLINRTTKEK